VAARVAIGEQEREELDEVFFVGEVAGAVVVVTITVVTEQERDEEIIRDFFPQFVSPANFLQLGLP